MQKTASILSLLTPFLLALALSACGSKGPLYQTPENEPVVAEQVPAEPKTADSQVKND